MAINKAAWLVDTFPAKKLTRINARRRRIHDAQCKVAADIETYKQVIAGLQRKWDKLMAEDHRLQRGMMHEHIRLGDLHELINKM